jgi:hypothetical protein
MKRSKHEGDGRTGVYMREGTTSKVMAADRSYGYFYDFYSVSPELFGETHVRDSALCPKSRAIIHVSCDSQISSNHFPHPLVLGIGYKILREAET